MRKFTISILFVILVVGVSLSLPTTDIGAEEDRSRDDKSQPEIMIIPCELDVTPEPDQFTLSDSNGLTWADDLSTVDPDTISVPASACDESTDKCGDCIAALIAAGCNFLEMTTTGVGHVPPVDDSTLYVYTLECS